ncbi:MAG: hypothetical protein H6767_00370 [Candidatus Peribacteria bacterium]|nr:MAG: hypothetical protein H6767_00370 [Candidatus Peribacteria bacterium]
MDTSMLQLTSTRLRISPICFDFREELFQEFSKEITTYMCPSPAQDISETDAFISQSIKEMKEGISYQAGIFHRET